MTTTTKRRYLTDQPTAKSHYLAVPKRLRGRTPEECLALHEQRVAARQRPVPYGVAYWLRNRGPRLGLGSRPPANVAPLPLGGHTHHDIKACTDAKKKNWKAAKASVYRSTYRTNDEGKYKGQWSNKTAYSYTPLVEAWAAVIGPKVLYYRIDTAGGIVRGYAKAPRGWHWDRDENGIRLANDRKPAMDYHPTAFDFIHTDPYRDTARLCVGRAKNNAASRRQWAKEQAAERREAKRTAAQERKLIRTAEAEGLMVCLADSVKAGNCAAGTIAWGQRHGLDPARHYRPTELLKMANGESRRVALAVSVALRRHRREMAEFSCSLAEHRG